MSEMHELTCNHCGERVSGPVKASVIAAMERHRSKQSHPAAVVPATPPETESKGRWPFRSST